MIGVDVGILTKHGAVSRCGDEQRGALSVQLQVEARGPPRRGGVGETQLYAFQFSSVQRVRLTRLDMIRVHLG